MVDVGEYVRTEKGLIAKYLGFEKEDSDEDSDMEYNKHLFDNKIYWYYEYYNEYVYEEDWEQFKESIVNHSKELIDLIEDKDIVEIELSEEFVEKKDKKKLIQIGDIYTKETLQKDIDNGIITRILTILSYNQYMANCYKVGGEDE